MFFFFGKKKDNPRGFPTFVSKTDEERVENQPWRIGDGKTYLATEKLDGTSCTYALERKGRNKFEFYVCSRNVRQQDEKQECYHDHNIYWDLAFKYNIEQHLRDFLNQFPQLKWVCIQGEGVGFVQGNPLAQRLLRSNVILSGHQLKLVLKEILQESVQLARKLLTEC